MSTTQIIKAQQDIDVGLAMIAEGQQLIYKAKEKLAGVSTPSSKKTKRSALTEDEVSKLIGNRFTQKKIPVR